jgi:hypothetical protein
MMDSGGYAAGGGACLRFRGTLPGSWPLGHSRGKHCRVAAHTAGQGVGWAASGAQARERLAQPGRAARSIDPPSGSYCHSSDRTRRMRFRERGECGSRAAGATVLSCSTAWHAAARSGTVHYGWCFWGAAARARKFAGAVPARQPAAPGGGGPPRVTPAAARDALASPAVYPNLRSPRIRSHLACTGPLAAGLPTSPPCNLACCPCRQSGARCAALVAAAAAGRGCPREARAALAGGPRPARQPRPAAQRQQQRQLVASSLVGSWEVGGRRVLGGDSACPRSAGFRPAPGLPAGAQAQNLVRRDLLSRTHPLSSLLHRKLARAPRARAERVHRARPPRTAALPQLYARRAHATLARARSLALAGARTSVAGKTQRHPPRCRD